MALPPLKLNVDPSGMVTGAKKGKDALKGVGDQAKKTENAAERMAARGGTAMRGLGTAMLGVVGAAGGMAAAFKAVKFFGGAVNEAEKFQTAMFRVNAIVKATGGSAGRSANQLREQARQLAFATLESTDGILQAQQTLLTFRGVQGEVFDRAISDAADLASAMGVGLNSAVLQLGKALEDPITGMTALTRSGTVFTESQKALVRSLVEAGKKAEAQRFILSELEKQYKGAARAAASGLAGSLDTLSQRFQEMQLAASKSFNLIATKQAAVDGLSAVLLSLTDNMDGIQAAFAGLGKAIEFLALAQIPRLVAGLYALATAGGVATGAMRALGAAVTIAGGPIGIAAAGAALLGIGLYKLLTGARDVTTVLNTATEAQLRFNAAANNYSTIGGPATRDQLTKAAQAYAKETKAKLASAQAELVLMQTKQLAGQALLDQNPLTKGDKTAGSMSAAMAENVRATKLEITGLKTLLAAMVRDLGGASEAAADTADGINAAQVAGEKMLADLQQQMSLQRAINKYGADSSQVAILKASAEMDTLKALLDQKGVTGDLRDQILATAYSANQLKEYSDKIEFQRGVSTAGLMAEKLGVSLKTASRLVEIMGGGSGVVYDPRDPKFNKTAAEMARIRNEYSTTLGGSSAPGGSSGGGGAASFDPLAAGQKQIASLRQQMEMLGKTARATAVLTAKNQLLAQAQERGVNLNAIVASSGLTVREVIERQAESIGSLAEKYRSAQEQAQFFETINNTLKNGILDAIVAGDTFADTMLNIAKMLEKAAFQALLFGEGPLSNLFGTSGGGGLGNFIGSLLGGAANGAAFSGGKVLPFARGGVVGGPTLFPMANGAGLMGEAGPEAVMPLKRGPGGKLGVQSSGGGGVVVQINNYTDQKATATRQKGPDGREIIKVVVGEEMARGSFDAPQKSRYGTATRRVKR